MTEGGTGRWPAGRAATTRNSAGNGALVVLVGPAGAGKSTLRARWPGAVVVSLDEHRGRLSACGCTANQDTDLRDAVVGLARHQAREALAAGATVLWDATSAEPEHRHQLVALARAAGARCTAVVVLPELPVVLARNRTRSAERCACGYARRVPDQVVVAMHEAISRDLPALPGEGWDDVMQVADGEVVALLPCGDDPGHAPAGHPGNARVGAAPTDPGAAPGAVPHFSDHGVTLWHGDALSVLRGMPGESVDCVVTSPPYWCLRNYGDEPGQIGCEPTPTGYIAALAAVFAEVHRVLHPAGTLWLNLDDVHAGKANAGVSVGRTRRADRAELIPQRVNSTAEAPYKSLLMLPERMAWALVEQGWCLRNRVVWHKTDAQPESVTDRLSHRHESLFLLVKSPRYRFDLDAIREPTTSSARARSWAERRAGGAPARHGTRGAVGDSDWAASARGRNPGDVWACSTAGFPGAHFAVMPERIAERCILAGCRPGGTVLDPFMGSGTTGMVATRLGRRFVGVDLHRPYLELALRTRLAQSALIEESAP